MASIYIYSSCSTAYNRKGKGREKERGRQAGSCVAQWAVFAMQPWGPEFRAQAFTQKVRCRHLPEILRW